MSTFTTARESGELVHRVFALDLYVTYIVNGNCYTRTSYYKKEKNVYSVIKI